MPSTSSPPVNAPSGDESDTNTRGRHPARVPFIGDTWRMHNGICKKEDRRRRELSVVEVGRPRRPALHPGPRAAEERRMAERAERRHRRVLRGVQGRRLRVKMPGENFWRTLMSSAIGLWRSLDRLHDQYVELAQKHPGKVPLVELIDVMEIKGRTTSYEPTFDIIDWVEPDEVLPGSASGQTGKPKVVARGDMDDEVPF